MTREEQIMNDPNLCCYVDKQRGWIHEFFMDGVRWADENRPVDWQQVRIQAAIAAMQGMCASKSFFSLANECIPQIAVKYADALVKELKGG